MRLFSLFLSIFKTWSTHKWGIAFVEVKFSRLKLGGSTSWAVWVSKVRRTDEFVTLLSLRREFLIPIKMWSMQQVNGWLSGWTFCSHSSAQALIFGKFLLCLCRCFSSPASVGGTLWPSSTAQKNKIKYRGHGWGECTKHATCLRSLQSWLFKYWK